VGGGATWRSGSYDPQLDLVYWGTGNAEPYDPRPRGALDSLYTSSVIALRPKTGEIVCHYQYTPNDVYDVDGNDEQVLADLRVNGEMRKVMIQANKNGFMYVVDRTNCRLIAAHPFVKVNWASHIDLTTGRPVLTDVYKRFLAGEEVEIWPSRGTNAVPMRPIQWLQSAFPNHSPAFYVGACCVAIIVAIGSKNVAAYVAVLFSARLKRRVATSLRGALFQTLQRANLDIFDQRPGGEFANVFLVETYRTTVAIETTVARLEALADDLQELVEGYGKPFEYHEHDGESKSAHGGPQAPR